MGSWCHGIVDPFVGLFVLLDVVRLHLQLQLFGPSLQQCRALLVGRLLRSKKIIVLGNRHGITVGREI